MHAARALLHGLGINLPTSVGSALGSLLVSRTMLALEGRAPKPAAAPLSARARMQLDAAWALAPPIAWIEPLASAVLSIRHLRMALRSGEPSHIARALAEDAFARIVQDPRDPRVTQLLESARTIAMALRDPTLEATLVYRQGTVATYRWEFEAARAAMENAQQMISERCPDQPFLLTNVRTSLGSIWTNRGEHARFADAARVWLDEARQRGDRFALTMITGLGYGFIPRLMAHDPDGAQEEMTELIASWPKEPFSFAHLGELLAMSCALLYRGGDHALRWHEAERARLSRAFLLRSGMGKAIYLSVRTLALLSAETVAGTAEAARLRAEAHATVRTLGGVRTMYAEHSAPFLAAQLAALDGRRGQALLMAREVCRKAEESGYLLHAHRARFLAAILAADSEQSETCASLLAYYEKQGWQRPRRVITMWCPILTGHSARPQSLAAE
jgi:hypothetical protein